ncbi:conjugal transfer protein TraC, partial [bacterium]|nr:conjugal transfer protein TraC [bacterium]
MTFSISKILEFIKKKKKGPAMGMEEIKEEEMAIVDFIAPSSVKVEPEFIQLGERLTKSFFVFSYPRYLSTGWVAPVINLNSPLLLSFFIHPMPTGYVLKQLMKKTTEIQAELAEREKKGLISDPKLETSFRDI